MADGPSGVLVESQDRNRNPRGDELLQRLLEVLAIGGGDNDTGQIRTKIVDVVEHIRIYVIVFVDLGLGKNTETHVADGFYPWANDICAAGGHISKDIGARFSINVLSKLYQPATDGVEARAVCGGRPTAQQGA